MRKRRAQRPLLVYQGQKMKSKEEVAFATQCDRQGIPWKYESEKLMWSPPLRPYTPDFILPKKSGGKMHIEKKSYLRPQDITKMRYVRKQHPEVDIRFVFSRASKPLGRVRADGTRGTHGDWATKNGYQWCDGFLPQAWINEVELKPKPRRV